VEISSENYEASQLIRSFKKGINSLVRMPLWHIDNDDKDYIPSQNSVIKAIINPGTPFIALPKGLFDLVAEKWIKQFKDLTPYCNLTFCLVPKPCSEVPDLEDFGIKLGSLNDTKPTDETVDQDYTDNMRYRGA
jgi:hypothetical protein